MIPTRDRSEYFFKKSHALRIREGSIEQQPKSSSMKPTTLSIKLVYLKQAN